MSEWKITVKQAVKTTFAHPGYMWYATGPEDEYLENLTGWMNHESAVQDAMATINIHRVMWTEKEETSGIWKYDYE